MSVIFEQPVTLPTRNMNPSAFWNLTNQISKSPSTRKEEEDHTLLYPEEVP